MLSTSLTGYRRSPPRPVVSHHRIHERRRVASPKERTAHHEAGHVCWNVFYWGRPIYSVSILPDELTKGLVRLTPESRPMPSGHIPECVVGNRDRARVVAEYYMAGLAAEANLRGTRAMWLAAEFETARAIIDTTWPRVEVGSVLRDCWIGACKFLAVLPSGPVSLRWPTPSSSTGNSTAIAQDKSCSTPREQHHTNIQNT